MLESADSSAVGWARHVRPRDRVAAARQCLGFTGAAAVVELIYFLSTPLSGGVLGVARSLGTPLGLLAIAVIMARYARRMTDLIWVTMPTLGVIGIVMLDITSHDASVQAQVFLFFPVLFAASQLPRIAARVLAAISVAGEVIVTFSSEPPWNATFDSLFVSTALLAASLLVTHSKATQDELIEQLGRLANADALTSLMTRRALDDVVRETLELNMLRRTEPEDGTALLLIDLDLFKTVNDTYGHPIGDDFLVHVAAFLTDGCRTEDLVGRVGGDEFAVLMRSCSHRTALDRGRTLLDQASQRPFVLPDGTMIPLRFTVGVGHVPAGAPSTLRELYAAADQALYQAKSRGRAQVA
jgi:diguanylate cyclase (GGDEF)-like protein